MTVIYASLGVVLSFRRGHVLQIHPPPHRQHRPSIAPAPKLIGLGCWALHYQSTPTHTPPLWPWRLGALGSHRAGITSWSGWPYLYTYQTDRPMEESANQLAQYWKGPETLTAQRERGQTPYLMSYRSIARILLIAAWGLYWHIYRYYIGAIHVQYPCHRHTCYR